MGGGGGLVVPSPPPRVQEPAMFDTAATVHKEEVLTHTHPQAPHPAKKGFAGNGGVRGSKSKKLSGDHFWS